MLVNIVAYDAEEHQIAAFDIEMERIPVPETAEYIKWRGELFQVLSVTQVIQGEEGALTTFYRIHMGMVVR